MFSSRGALKNFARSLLAVGCWLLVIGHWLLVVGCGLVLSIQPSTGQRTNDPGQVTNDK
jgi:hypothetical protein